MKEQLKNFMNKVGVLRGEEEFNLFEVAKLKEFRHSEILFRLFTYSMNGRYQFLERFIRRAIKSADGWKFSEGNVHISREEHIEGRPIDVLVVSGSKALIVENKCCNACDMDSQLHDYIENVRSRYNINVEDLSCLYIRQLDSLSGPSEDSTVEKDIMDMITVSSYRELVLPWLKFDVLPIIPYQSGVMVASLVAYIDMLEGWSGERSRMKNNAARIVSAFLSEYGCSESEAYDVVCHELKLTKSVEQYEGAIQLLAFVKQQLWERNPFLDPFLVVEEMKWMLRNNAYPYGRTAMRNQIDAGDMFDSCARKYREVSLLERSVIAPDGRSIAVRIHCNCGHVMAPEDQWFVYGGTVGFVENLPQLDYICSVMSEMGFAIDKEECNGFFFNAPFSIMRDKFNSESGRDTLWSVTKFFAECARVYSDALVAAGYKVA